MEQADGYSEAVVPAAGENFLIKMAPAHHVERRGAALFVYADGQVGLRDIGPLAAGAPMFHQVRSRVFGYMAPDERVSIDAPIEIETDDYRRCGRMFDGRPVFCAAGFSVKEAYITVITNLVSWKRVENQNRRDIRKMLRREHPDAIELDEWCGAIPLDIELQGQALTRRAVRLLVAVRNS